jgi:hypothetical protein
MPPQPPPVLIRKDRSGRALSLPQLASVALVGTAIGLVVVAVIDGITALIGFDTFGQASGWLAVILPALIFIDDFRAWRGHTVRYLVALVGAAVAAAVGLVIAGLVPGWPLLTGTIGSICAVVVYAPMWFLGVRWLSGELPREGR